MKIQRVSVTLASLAVVLGTCAGAQTLRGTLVRLKSHPGGPTPPDTWPVLSCAVIDLTSSWQCRLDNHDNDADVRSFYQAREVESAPSQVSTSASQDILEQKER